MRLLFGRQVQRERGGCGSVHGQDLRPHGRPGQRGGRKLPRQRARAEAQGGYDTTTIRSVAPRLRHLRSDLQDIIASNERHWNRQKEKRHPSAAGSHAKSHAVQNTCYLLDLSLFCRPAGFSAAPQIALSLLSAWNLMQVERKHVEADGDTMAQVASLASQNPAHCPIQSPPFHRVSGRSWRSTRSGCST